MRMTSNCFRSLAFVALLSLGTVLSFPSFAQTSSEEKSPDTPEPLDTTLVQKSIREAQAQSSSIRKELIKDLALKLQEVFAYNSESDIKREAVNNRDLLEEMPDYDTVIAVASERAKSTVLSEEVRRELNRINYEMNAGYGKINGAAAFGKDISYSGQPLQVRRELYNLHVSYFCDPAAEYKPDGCGRERNLIGVEGTVNFIDFFLSDKTWPKRYALDAMQLIRAFFFKIPDRINISGLSAGPVEMIKQQGDAAKNALRMSIFNDLAARRAPTSTSTKNTMEMLLMGFADAGGVSSIHYKDICDRVKNPKPTAFDLYACGFSNNPEQKTVGSTSIPMPDLQKQDRMMGQAGIDRILQHDYYMSPVFYNAINSQVPAEGALDKMEVYMLAQQVSQDYRLLRLLQMRTAVQALKIQGDAPPVN